MTAVRAYRTITWAFLAFGFGVLLVSYAGISERVGSLWPWNLVVHEDGVRTLLATVLYYEHGARELLVDLVLGLAIGGCLLFACPPDTHRAVSGVKDKSGISGAAIAFGLAVAIILGGSAFNVGLSGLRDNLLQYHTRPFTPLEWGSHWRYHLLSRLALIFGSLGIAAFLRYCIGSEPGQAARRGLTVFGASLVVFAILTAVFSSGASTFTLPLFDTVYLGHQAREAFTHVLATVPITWGICLLAVRPAQVPSSDARARIYLWPITVAGGALGAIMGLYVALGALINDSAAQGQTDDLAMLIFPHFFEHALSYFVIPAAALLTYRIFGRRSS